MEDPPGGRSKFYLPAGRASCQAAHISDPSSYFLLLTAFPHRPLVGQPNCSDLGPGGKGEKHKQPPATRKHRPRNGFSLKLCDGALSFYDAGIPACSVSRPVCQIRRALRRAMKVNYCCCRRRFKCIRILRTIVCFSSSRVSGACGLE